MTKITNETIPPNQWIIESKRFIDNEVDKLDGSGDLYEKIKMIYIRALNLSKDTVLKSARSNLSNEAFLIMSKLTNESFNTASSSPDVENSVVKIINNSSLLTQPLAEPTAYDIAKIIEERFHISPQMRIGKTISPQEKKRIAQQIIKFQFYINLFEGVNRPITDSDFDFRNSPLNKLSTRDKKAWMLFVKRMLTIEMKYFQI
jgi:hypothetical protein